MIQERWVTQAGWSLAYLALFCVGCGQDAPTVSRWDEAQRRSTGGAIDSDRPRYEEPATYDDDLSEEPPAWNPQGGSQGPTTKTEWTPRGATAGESVEKTPIDLKALQEGDPLPGGEFNRFFPKQSGEWDIVYKQEKSGFALASLQKDGEEVAMLSITDLRSNPSAAEKYQRPEKQIAGYPAVAIGSQGDGVLVASRFQVQVRSQSKQFTPGNREDWIQRFDLEGLSQLQ